MRDKGGPSIHNPSILPGSFRLPLVAASTLEVDNNSSSRDRADQLSNNDNKQTTTSTRAPLNTGPAAYSVLVE